MSSDDNCGNRIGYFRFRLERKSFASNLKVIPVGCKSQSAG